LKTYYKNDLKHAYLILEGAEGEQEDYQIAMLRENEIGGILKTEARFMDNCIHYYYDISGKTSVGILYEKKNMCFEEMKQLVDELLVAMKNAREYMLDGNCILLEPEWIYRNKDHFFFCYYPSCEQDIREKFHKLTEFFVREVDYQDEEGVRFAYTLHKATMDDNYSIEEILREFLPQEPVLQPEEIPTEYEYEEDDEEEEDLPEEEPGMWESVVSFINRVRNRKSQDL